MPNFLSAVQTNRIPVLGLVPEKSAVAPANPVFGQLWADTSSTPGTGYRVKWYDGTQWVPADYSSMPDGWITDAKISGTAAIALSKLAVDPLARAGHTGTQLAATISDFDTRVRTNRLDQLAKPTADLDINGNRLTNVADPTLPGHAANKNYVDNARAGISVKDPVRVVASGNVNLAAPGTTIDGVTMQAGNRFLAPAQTTGTDSGIYVWNGSAVAATRASDADAAGEVFDGSLVAVAEGSKAGYQYIQTASPSGAPGTWTQTWIVFQTGGQTYTGSAPLVLTGTNFSLDTVPVASGGTGSTTAAGARLALGAVGKYAADLPAMTAGVAVTVTHGLGSQDVVPTFRTTIDGVRVDLDYKVISGTQLTVTSDLTQAAGAVRIVVVG